MREILFRGFVEGNVRKYIFVEGNKVNGVWRTGTPFLLPNGKQYIHGYIGDFSEKEEYWCTSQKIVPGTLGQYTGIKDKYGQKIFEGDKVKGFNELRQREEKYIVMWACNNGFYFVDDSGTEWHPEHVIPCEIIGTVFDVDESVD